MIKFMFINGWIPLFLLVVRPLSLPYPFMNFMTVTFLKKSSVEKKKFKPFQKNRRKHETFKTAKAKKQN